MEFKLSADIEEAVTSLELGNKDLEAALLMLETLLKSVESTTDWKGEHKEVFSNLISLSKQLHSAVNHAAILNHTTIKGMIADSDDFMDKSIYIKNLEV